MKLYLRMYLKFAQDSIKNLEHMSEMKVLLYIVDDCQKDTLQWTSYKSKRMDIAIRLGVGVITVNRALSTLSKKGFIQRVSRGVYKLNRDHFDFG